MPGNQYVSPERIRLFLLDRSATDNFLLDDVDFSNEVLEMAQDLTYDRYTTTDPFINVDFTVETFPFKMEFLTGVAGFALRMKGANMVRNALPFSSAGGSQVDDKKLGENYIALGDKFLAEYDSRIRKIKTHININQGYGSQGSAYGFYQGEWQL